MSKRTGPTNPYLKTQIEDLRKRYFESKTAIWLKIAEKLAKPRRSRIEVNLAQIDRNAAKDETVVVPGIVLASGELSKPVNVAAWKFSGSAESKIKKAKGKSMTIAELAKDNPKGTGVRLLA
jgi:large subunit ribosomal protein L18e